MMFLRIFQHLLPNAKAWRITADKKLRQFFEGLSATGDDVKTFVDDVWLDIFPSTTRELSEWESQFGLINSVISEQERRDRLDATWKALGGQDPRYIQDTLRGAGFDVYVYDWWVEGTEPAVGVKQCVTPRNPLTLIREEFTGVNPLVECGEALAECGEVFAEAGNGINPRGYPLVNKIFTSTPDFINLCGEEDVEAGEAAVGCGSYFGFEERLVNYTVPSDPEKWPYFLYIGGPTIDSIAQVEPSRKDEFEALCLKICPSQLWLGILVEYV